MVRYDHMLLVFAIGCSSPGPTAAPPEVSPPSVDEDTATDTATDTASSPPQDTAAAPVNEDTIGDQVLEDDWIFDHTIIHEIEITLPQESLDSLSVEPYSYAIGSVLFNDESMTDVGIRLRGKIGSFRDLSGKPKLKIDFNQYVEDQRFYGLETLSLNNSIVDCSFLKEHVGYALFAEADVPASRTGVARVWVNGEPYGLYTIIEVPDDRFLRRHYENPDGNLYDGKYVWDGTTATLLDFATGYDTLFQLEEGEDVGHADISAVSAAISAAAGTAEWYETTGAVVDWPLLHRLWAVEQWLGQNDGYGLNTNNYRVYFDPSDGRADLIPWDLDYTFLYDSDWGRSWYTPYGTLFYYCIFDSTCAAAQKAAVAEILEAADAAALVSRFDAIAALIDSDARSDPRRECSESSMDYEQERVRAWLEGQNAILQSFWGL